MDKISYLYGHDNIGNEKAFLEERMKQLKKLDETYKGYATSKVDYLERSVAHYELLLATLSYEVDRFINGQADITTLKSLCDDLDLDTEAVKLMEKYNIGYFKDWGDSDDLHD
ncbi:MULTISPECIES: hypothetical protein [Aerococcus]|uniref:hypothetical protein n=1 Tax=Aerococcus TaxID=1375 RepID=UPI0018A7889F|nr:MULTISPECIES: hypothetical protein [Aerococcus]MCY3039820.1 hypothetical protein [Aerococcus sp. Group 2]MCY3040354.1 hypothetical protein [Aerococcus sp. Group 2]MCY3043278.1 hypothetical protein [Aerococcus sp. Group 2]MDK6519799.1 hypothetical protein [Aerococcus urinae]